MLDKTDDVSISAENWLARVRKRARKPGDGSLKRCFIPTAIGAMCWR